MFLTLRIPTDNKSPRKKRNILDHKQVCEINKHHLYIANHQYSLQFFKQFSLFRFL